MQDPKPKSRADGEGVGDGVPEAKVAKDVDKVEDGAHDGILGAKVPKALLTVIGDLIASGDLQIPGVKVAAG